MSLNILYMVISCYRSHIPIFEGPGLMFLHYIHIFFLHVFDNSGGLILS